MAVGPGGSERCGGLGSAGSDRGGAAAAVGRRRNHEDRRATLPHMTGFFLWMAFLFFFKFANQGGGLTVEIRTISARTLNLLGGYFPASASPSAYTFKMAGRGRSAGVRAASVGVHRRPLTN